MRATSGVLDITSDSPELIAVPHNLGTLRAAVFLGEDDARTPALEQADIARLFPQLATTATAA